MFRTVIPFNGQGTVIASESCHKYTSSQPNNQEKIKVNIRFRSILRKKSVQVLALVVELYLFIANSVTVHRFGQTIFGNGILYLQKIIFLLAIS